MGMPLKDTSEFVSVGESAASVDAAAIAAGHPSVGERLAAVRKAKGLSYQDVFNGTKIKIANIAAIEAGDRRALPAIPFAAGFVKAYAQYLGLNPEEYAAAYRAECASATAGDATLAQPDVAATAEAPVEIAAPHMPSPAPVFAPPAQSRNSQPLSPEKYVSYFGVAATVLCALWIGARVASPKAAPTTPEARVEAAGAAPFALAAAAPAAPSLKQTAAGIPAGSSGTAEGQTVEASPTALVDRKEVSAGAAAKTPPALSAAEKEKADALAAALNPQAEQSEPEPTAEALPVAPTPSRKPLAGPIESAAPAAEPAPVVEPTPPAPVVPSPPVAAPQTTPSRVVEARLTRNVEPKYPERCTRRAAPVETVELAFAINLQGAPTGIYVAESSNECFNSAALDAAYDLRFSPRTENGKPVLQEGKRVTFRFAR